MTRRRFNTGERVALLLRSGFRCALCGEKLGPGWHADHVRPISRGGSTAVWNGQALCAACNLRKGNTIVVATETPKATARQPHEWQVRNLDRFTRKLAATPGQLTFSTFATMGAGKTYMLLLEALKATERRQISPWLVLVPTEPLKQQWTKDAAVEGLQLDPDFSNKHGVMRGGFHGVVATYAQLAMQPSLFEGLFGHPNAGVILDEPHHLGDAKHLSWGPAVAHAFRASGVVLSASGTLFRTDGVRIPFVPLSDDGKYAPDDRYPYAEALAHGVVPAVTFPLYEGEFRWISGKVEHEAHFADLVPDPEVSRRLKTATMPDGEWMRTVITEANNRLEFLRRYEDTDAGGLIITRDQEHARKVQELVYRVTGIPAAIVISDDADAVDTIAQFADGTRPWVVAVMMIREGINIPRLRELIYASNIVTDLNLDQAVGRLLRGDEDGVVRFPADPRFREYARRFITEREAAMVAGDEGGERNGGDGSGAGGNGTGSTFQPLGADAAAILETIHDGVSISEATRQAVIERARLVGVSLSDKEVAKFAQMFPDIQPVTAIHRHDLPVVSMSKRLKEQKKILRHKVSRYRDLMSMADHEVAMVYSYLNRHAHDEQTVPTASLDGIVKRIEIMDRLIDGRYALD